MIYLDNAATSFPKSGAALMAIINAYSTCGNAGRSGYNISVEASRRLYSCREALAEMFGTIAENVILTNNTTTALNMAIKGIVKDSAVISNLEHNSVYRPLFALSKKGTKLNMFEVDLYDDDKTLESFVKASKGIKTAVITHASNVCGRVLPIKRLTEQAKKQEMIVIVDAAQTAGHFPMNITELGIDILCIAGHKGLYGPLGTGAMLINPSFTKKIDTIIEGGSGLYSFEEEMPNIYPERFEAGTQNAVSFAGLDAAVRNFKYPSVEKLFVYLSEQLKEINDITLYGAPKNNYNQYTPVILFNKKSCTGDQAADFLAQEGICVRSGFHCSPLAHKALGTEESGGVRISLGRHNTKRDIDMLINAILKM